MDFIKGILFLMIYVNTLRTIGKVIIKKSSFFESIIFGYLGYYFVQFFLAFAFQYLLLPLKIYYWIIAGALIVINLYSIILLFKDHPAFSGFVSHIKNYWLVYLFSAVLLFLSVIYAPGHWLGNNLDDGYYVMKIINFVNCINVNIDPSTGFTEHMKLMTKISRIISGYELDLASYCYLFKIDVLIFINYIYTWFNYFLILIVSVTFFEKIFGNQEKLALTASLVGTALFAFYPAFFTQLQLAIQDSWQFNSAIWYGSSICRIPGLFILFLGLFYFEKQYLKQFIYLVVCSFVLMSKGNQILPILAFSFFLYAMFWLWDRKLPWIIKLLPIPLFAGASIVFDRYISYTTEVGANIVAITNSNMNNPIFLVVIVSFLLLMLVFRKNKYLLRWNFVLLFCAVFSYVDALNDVLTTFSLYYFVAARATTLIFYSVVITIAYEVVCLLAKVLKARSLVLISLVMALLISGADYVYIGKDAIDYVVDNPTLVYEPTVELSKYLNQLDIENGDEQVRVVCTMMFYHRYLIALSTSLRYYAKDIVIISNEYRYPCGDETNSVSNFTEQYSSLVTLMESDEYQSAPMDMFENMLNETEANTVVFTSDHFESQLNSMGYNCIHEVLDSDGNIQYHVYYKE